MAIILSRMSIEQVHSFIEKFFSLWANGSDASLQLKLLDGKCKVIMELAVGDYTCSPNAPDTDTLCSKPSITVSPSRQRRRECRIKDRAQKADEIEEVKQAVAELGHTRIPSCQLSQC